MRQIACVLALVAPSVLAATDVAPPHAAPVERASVQFSAGDITVHADVLQPAGAVAAPGVVLIHGSGSSGRTNAWAAGFAEGLAARGVAVLLPDKRGSGASGGDWRTADFETLARDAIAGVRWLQARRGVNPRAVGVIGLSQGGHIAPLAAVRSDQVAFVVSVSSSTVPMLDQIIDEVEKHNERGGLPADIVAAVTALHRTAERTLFDDAPFAEYLAARATLADGPWGTTVQHFPTTEAHWLWGWLRRVGRYDPLPYWQALPVPGLIAYGARDTQIRVARSISRLEPVLTGIEARRLTLVVYGDTGHALYEADRAAIRAEFLDLAAEWIGRVPPRTAGR